MFTGICEIFLGNTFKTSWKTPWYFLPMVSVGGRKLGFRNLGALCIVFCGISTIFSEKVLVLKRGILEEKEGVGFVICFDFFARSTLENHISLMNL